MSLESDELPPPTEEELADVPMYEPDAPTFRDVSYPDWDETTTRVISGPLGETKFPGRRFDNWLAAKRDVNARAEAWGKKVYAFWTVPGRWFGRIAR